MPSKGCHIGKNNVEYNQPINLTCHLLFLTFVGYSEYQIKIHPNIKFFVMKVNFSPVQRQKCLLPFFLASRHNPKSQYYFSPLLSSLLHNLSTTIHISILRFIFPSFNSVSLPSLKTLKGTILDWR